MEEQGLGLGESLSTRTTPLREPRSFWTFRERGEGFGCVVVEAVGIRVSPRSSCRDSNSVAYIVVLLPITVVGDLDR